MTIAVVAALAALAGAILTQAVNIVLWRGDRRVTALDSLQEAVLALRELTMRYGLAVREAFRNAELVEDVLDPSYPNNIVVDWEAALARLSMVISRVDDTRVASTIAVWRDLVESRAMSSETVSSAEERAAFDAVVDAIGQAARSQTGRGDRRWLWRRRV